MAQYLFQLNISSFSKSISSYFKAILLTSLDFFNAINTYVKIWLNIKISYLCWCCCLFQSWRLNEWWYTMCLQYLSEKRWPKFWATWYTKWPNFYATIHKNGLIVRHFLTSTFENGLIIVPFIDQFQPSSTCIQGLL